MPAIFPENSSGIQTSRDDLVTDVEPSSLVARIRELSDPANADDQLRERYAIEEHARWRWPEHRREMAAFDQDRVVSWLYRLFDRRFLYWDPALISWPRTKFARHLLPRPLGHGGELRLALVVQRARPITTIATVTRGIATAHVTSQWDHIYPLHLAEGLDDEQVLLPVEQTWRPNLDASVLERLTAAYGVRLSVEQVAWYVFGVLSAPAYRDRFNADLAIDHPRIPFPVSRELFEAMAELGERLGQAHLLEAPIAPEVRFVGEGSNRVETIRHDPATKSIWINATQHFTAAGTEAWAWGGSFRPLEHFLTDRKGRTLDVEQIEMYLRAVTAVLTAIDLEPNLDAVLVDILAKPLRFVDASEPEAGISGLRR